MTDNTKNLVLEILTGLRNEFRDFRTEMREVITRLGHIERAIAGMRSDAAEVYEARVRQQVAIDKLAARVERIERHLELGGKA